MEVNASKYLFGENSLANGVKSPNGRVDGKVAVVTGDATGMGWASALAFAEEGAKVSIFDIQNEEGQKTIDMIRGTGGEAAFSSRDQPNL
ncbi:hypothetical protein DL239_15910 [Sedimentitalea sp. CY04]|uniref:SDR family NAD(P)-dependent oxidoreductase n=1 Tax=Parasedimentitalea denitrificans TaxID=2211118 RepID=A0ABX0WCS6_9RHOB|nr:SDR family NAD(P)-dependent oxidoreductase [Sedimentitalea sp. CY04]NIZ62457.1 hypothetical protein [Sedimentitalea sp. CY04]